MGQFSRTRAVAHVARIARTAAGRTALERDRGHAVQRDVQVLGPLVDLVIPREVELHVDTGLATHVVDQHDETALAVVYGLGVPLAGAPAAGVVERAPVLAVRVIIGQAAAGQAGGPARQSDLMRRGVTPAK